MAWSGWRDVETSGVLVAGRSYDLSDLNRGQVIALGEAIDAIGERAGVPIVLAPADVDLSDDTCTDDDPAYCSGFVGVLVAEGGTYSPQVVPREEMLSALDRARAVPSAVWDEITRVYREAGGKQEPSDEIALRLGCTGGLPMAYLAYGVEEEIDEDSGGDGLVRGQSPGQEPHESGVRGLKLAACSYDGSSAGPIDVSDEAHAARAAKVPNGAYHLIARYD